MMALPVLWSVVVCDLCTVENTLFEDGDINTFRAFNPTQARRNPLDGYRQPVLIFDSLLQQALAALLHAVLCQSMACGCWA